MKKLISLIKASMTSDMNLFKIKQKRDGKKSNMVLPLVISLFLMFTIWSNSNILFEQVEPLHLQGLIMSLFIFGISFMTIVEGIYKTGSLLFNCKDDQLLLSLPIRKSTVLFIRIFKFYVFELLFNSIFVLPIMIAYIRWGENIDYTYYITSLIMLILLPVIPIVLSSLIGAFTTSISSRFKYKNLFQIVISMSFVLIIMVISFNSTSFYNYIINHADSINSIVTKIYYPSGAYLSLITDFNTVTLIIFIVTNIIIFILGILFLSIFYFKINSRLKKVTVGKKISINNLTIKASPSIISLIKKELNIFFKTPVFIVNAGFALVLFLIISVVICFKFDDFVNMVTNFEGLPITKDFINNNLSIVILVLVLLTSFMTSITNSVVSLEGKNINLLKSLPVKTKTILMSKIYSSLVLTTPILFIGDVILFVKLKVGILEIVLLLLLSIITPLISHFIGIIINLKYPKLDFESSAEVVKQSTSSFIAVTLGMIILMVSTGLSFYLAFTFGSLLTLVIVLGVYTLIDILLYLYLVTKGVKQFNELSV